jgi:preprotein translocase subunit Sec63
VVRFAAGMGAMGDPNRHNRGSRDYCRQIARMTRPLLKDNNMKSLFSRTAIFLGWAAVGALITALIVALVPLTK